MEFIEIFATRLKEIFEAYMEQLFGKFMFRRLISTLCFGFFDIIGRRTHSFKFMYLESYLSIFVYESSLTESILFSSFLFLFSNRHAT